MEKLRRPRELSERLETESLLGQNVSAVGCLNEVSTIKDVV